MRSRILVAACAVTILGACAEPAPPVPPWSEVELGTGAQFKDVFFLDESRGWLVGGGYPVEGGILGATVDGGQNWTFTSGLMGRGPKTHNRHLQAVVFLDPQLGFIAADEGKILRTVDGGAHWHVVHRSGRHFQDIFFVDSLHGWATDGPRLFATVDGGDSWNHAFDPASKTPYNGNALQFLNRTTGFAVGVAGSIYRTEDGGRSWVEQVFPKTGRPTLRDVSFVDSLTGWAVGEQGVIFGTVDGGEKWQRQVSNTDASLTGVHFFDRSSGWVVGFRRADSSSVLLETLDGGLTWVERQRTEGQALFALSFTGTAGWAVGERVRPYSQRLLRYRVE